MFETCRWVPNWGLASKRTSARERETEWDGLYAVLQPPVFAAQGLMLIWYGSREFDIDRPCPLPFSNSVLTQTTHQIDPAKRSKADNCLDRTSQLLPVLPFNWPCFSFRLHLTEPPSPNNPYRAFDRANKQHKQSHAHTLFSPDPILWIVEGKINIKYFCLN